MPTPNALNRMFGERQSSNIQGMYRIILGNVCGLIPTAPSSPPNGQSSQHSTLMVTSYLAVDLVVAVKGKTSGTECGKQIKGGKVDNHL